jgi:glycosyltransferase involved in cell wall biosynthesis
MLLVNGLATGAFSFNNQKKINSMNLGFYYHVPICRKQNTLHAPSHFAVFLEELANQVETLTLYMHESKDPENCDGVLSKENIVWENLGVKTPAWHRSLFHSNFLKKHKLTLNNFDVFLVRAPSPLAPFFQHYFIERKRIMFLVVGDYMDVAQNMPTTTIREKVVSRFLKNNYAKFLRTIKYHHVMVNSNELLKLYQPIAKSVDLIKTTTLKKVGFFERTDSCQSDSIELLYTGRIDLNKGLLDLLEATRLLLAEGFKVTLNIVGWEEDNNKRPIETMMRNLAQEYKIEKQLVFHGKKSVGAELNQMYQKADIYVIPSYNEGFPRTIWEAMANSLPVIASSVGGIPAYLTHKVNAMLISPREPYKIVQAIKELIRNGTMRRAIIKNGFELAKDNTLEVQTAKMISSIKARL